MSDGALAVVDRAKAIEAAIDDAAADDVILIAGKGHENYQVIGERTLTFSDVGAASACLAARSARQP